MLEWPLHGLRNFATSNLNTSSFLAVARDARSVASDIGARVDPAFNRDGPRHASRSGAPNHAGSRMRSPICSLNQAKAESTNFHVLTTATANGRSRAQPSLTARTLTPKG